MRNAREGDGFDVPKADPQWMCSRDCIPFFALVEGRAIQ